MIVCSLPESFELITWWDLHLASCNVSLSYHTQMRLGRYELASFIQWHKNSPCIITPPCWTCADICQDNSLLCVCRTEPLAYCNKYLISLKGVFSHPAFIQVLLSCWTWLMFFLFFFFRWTKWKVKAAIFHSKSTEIILSTLVLLPCSRTFLSSHHILQQKGPQTRCL